MMAVVQSRARVRLTAWMTALVLALVTAGMFVAPRLALAAERVSSWVATEDNDTPAPAANRALSTDEEEEEREHLEKDDEDEEPATPASQRLALRVEFSGKLTRGGAPTRQSLHEREPDSPPPRA